MAEPQGWGEMKARSSPVLSFVCLSLEFGHAQPDLKSVVYTVYRPRPWKERWKRQVAEGLRR